MPGRANTVSVTTASDSSAAKVKPNAETTASSALRRMWRRTTCHGRMPLARAVRT